MASKSQLSCQKPEVGFSTGAERFSRAEGNTRLVETLRGAWFAALLPRDAAERLGAAGSCGRRRQQCHTALVPSRLAEPTPGRPHRPLRWEDSEEQSRGPKALVFNVFLRVSWV